MSEDQFKNFVENNREDFESYQGDYHEMWIEIEKGLSQPVMPLWQQWARIAATLIILAISGWVAITYQRGEVLPVELRETEDHYYSIINAKMELAEAHHQEIDDLIWEDLELLDQAYIELKNDLKEQVDDQEVVEAMIENYRAKLEILDQILDEIEKEDEYVEGLDL